jgi:hypothetical protein
MWNIHDDASRLGGKQDLRNPEMETGIAAASAPEFTSRAVSQRLASSKLPREQKGGLILSSVQLEWRANKNLFRNPLKNDGHPRSETAPICF